MTGRRLRADATFAMPWSNVFRLPFPERLRATRLAGLSAMSAQPQELLRVAAAGLPVREMKALADDAGVSIARLDPLCTWIPDWRPVNFGQDFADDHDLDAEVVFDLCGELGATTISLNATFPAGRHPVEAIVDHYAQICDRAARHGLLCDLEAIPMWGVTSLEMAWDIVRRSGAPNGGLVFDATHFVRGGSTLAALRDIPGRFVHCVQLCDGVATLPPGVALEQECFERLWPGEGAFPIAGMLEVLAETGGLAQVGPEVFSHEMAGLGAEEIARRTRTALLRYDALVS